MSYISVRGEQSTSTEIAALTALTALATGAAGEFIRKTGATSFENATPSASSGATAALDNLAAVAINAALVLGTSDAFALGSATKMWSDLFLASGAVINFNNGDVTLTHGANVLTVGGGDLALGTNSLTMTGSIAATGARVTKGWFTDVESTNMYTVGGTSLSSTFAPLTSPTFGTSITGSYLTASEILITDGSKNIVSAAVATYPSLTELTYVKGVTSAIQTQLGAKASTALDNLASVAINTTLVSDTDNTDSLGTAAIGWSDLFLGSGAVITFSSAPSTADVTITHSADTLTIAGGNLALGANSLTMTGSLAATGARVTKGWFTDIESTNMPTVGGTAILTSLTAPQFTTIELGHASANTLSASGGVLSVEGIAVMTVAGATLTGNITYGENTAMVYDPVLSADGKYCGEVRAGTAGATLAFGDLVYLASADSRWELADADAATTADRLLGMVVLAAASDGDPTTILLQGFIRADAAFPAMTMSATAPTIRSWMTSSACASSVDPAAAFAASSCAWNCRPTRSHSTDESAQRSIGMW